MQEQILQITNFSGGISSASKAGVRGAFRWGQGCDIYSDPDLLQVSPATTKDSDTTITDLIQFGTTNTVNTNTYWLGSTGRLYKRTALGVWSLLTTLSGGNAQGLSFFSGTNLIYGASGNTQFTLNPATDVVVASYRTLNTADFHPSEAFLDKIFTGNGRELISTDASAINYTSSTAGGGITIEYNYKIRCLKNIGDWLFIGATSDNSSDARGYLWDGTSEGYNYRYPIKGEDGINAVELADDGTILIFAGKKGNVYQLTSLGSNPVKIKTLPRIGNGKTIEVYPQATANYQGKVLFGLSTGTSTTAERGVYSWASTDKNYPKVLNMDYAISTATTTGTTLQIGCLLAIDTNNLFVSWRDNTSYGVDKVDGTGVQATALCESLIFDNRTPNQIKEFKSFYLKLANNLQTGETITLAYKADRATSWTDIGSMDYSVNGAIHHKAFKKSIRCYELEIRLSFTNSGTTASVVDSIDIVFEKPEELE